MRSKLQLLSPSAFSLLTVSTGLMATNVDWSLFSVNRPYSGRGHGEQQLGFFHRSTELLETMWLASQHRVKPSSGASHCPLPLYAYSSMFPADPWSQMLLPLAPTYPCSSDESTGSMYSCPCPFEAQRSDPGEGSIAASTHLAGNLSNTRYTEPSQEVDAFLP